MPPKVRFPLVILGKDIDRRYVFASQRTARASFPTSYSSRKSTVPRRRACRISSTSSQRSSTKQSRKSGRSHLSRLRRAWSLQGHHILIAGPREWRPTKNASMRTRSIPSPDRTSRSRSGSYGYQAGAVVDELFMITRTARDPYRDREVHEYMLYK